MAKLSNFLLKTIVFASVNAEDDPIFQVTSCNTDVSIILGSRLNCKRVNYSDFIFLGKRSPERPAVLGIITTVFYLASQPFASSIDF